MDFYDVLRRRRMVRSFAPDPLDPALVDRLLAASLRAPTAGNTGGTAWVVVESPATDTFWSATTTARWRADSARFFGLARAPVVAVSLASPERYLDRYAEPDKAASGLGPADPDGATGGGIDAWPVPYWFGDAAFACLTVLLGATAEGLGACFLGNFRAEADLLSALAVPPGWRYFGAVLLGHPDGSDHASPSLARPRPPDARRIHRGTWTGP